MSHMQDGTASFGPTYMQPTMNPTMQNYIGFSGNLVIRPLTARLTRTTSFFGKMDPLVKVVIGTHYQKTPYARKGHKNPGWETELSMRRANNEEFIHFQLWDRDIVSRDDLIASGELSFATVFENGNRFNGWINLRHKEKSVGQLLVDIVFIPDTKLESKSTIQTKKSQSMMKMPTIEIDESKVLEGDPHRIVRKKSIGGAYSIPLQGETHTNYSPTSRSHKGTMTTQKDFFQPVVQQPMVQSTMVPANYQDQRRYSGTTSAYVMKRDAEISADPGDIISGFYERERLGKSQKVRTLEGGYGMERPEDLGHHDRSHESSYYHSREPVNRSMDRKELKLSSMERHHVTTADQAI